MKPNTANRTVVSTVEGEAVKMAIASGSEQHLMGLLTNLYEDPLMALFREYGCNALDSHIEAGQKRPIEVSLPSSMRPFLMIRDYGIGLDEDGIRNIYSQYGASTKRDTNEQTGTFGLGCKSALAYADQFTLTAWKDGKRMSVSVSRDEHGAGVMTILEPPAPDDGEQGVEVCIPSRRGDKFEDKATEFFRFWPQGTVLIDGKEPKRPPMFRLNDDMAILTEDDEGYRYRQIDVTPIIIMGNVPYKHELGDLGLPYRKRLVAQVPIGSCDVAPAREGLMDTAHTRKTLEALVQKFKDDRALAARRELEKSTDRSDAVRRAIEACASLGINGNGLEWKGEPVPLKLERTVADGKDRRFWHVAKQRMNYGGRGNNNADRVNTLHIEAAIACEAWITNFTNQSWSKPMREKLDNYVDAHNLAKVDDTGGQKEASQRTYGLVPDGTVPERKWFGPTIIDWAKVKAWKDPNRQTATGGGGLRTAGTYPLYEPDGQWHRTFDADDIDTTKPIVWLISRPGESSYSRTTLMECGFRDFTQVELSNSRLAKFKRDFPQARTYEEVLAEAKTKMAAKLTQEERDAIVSFDGDRTLVYSFPNPKTLPDDTDDAEWNRLIELARLWNDRGSAKRRHLRLSDVKGTKHTLTTDAAVHRYPLIGTRRLADSAKMKQHIKSYINSIHNEGGSV